jgi:hypothetical protein|nr:MAG TPA: hypothetical protein [Caudoviricetes sp.]
MVRSSGEQLQGGKQRQEEGTGRYRSAPNRRSLGKSSTKKLLETVKAPTEGRIAEQGQITIILTARKDGHRTFHFWRFGKTKNVSFSIDRSERRSTKLTAGETAERQNCFSHLTAGKTAHHFFWQPERRQIKDVSQTACRRAKTAALMASMEGIARVQHPPYSSRFLPFLPFLCKIDAKHLAHAPGSNPGLATIFQKSERG